MALFSFRHSVKTFSKKVVKQSREAAKGQTLAHIRYISRNSASRTILSARLPATEVTDVASIVEDAAERSSGRVCERFTIALPFEATLEQREKLLLSFAEKITKGKAGFLASIHDKNGNDISNPHAHLICFDAFTKKGGRGRPTSVMGMARKYAVETAAEEWARIHNTLMASWGYGSESMIDHRSYAEQGIEQIPTIHEGAGARIMERAGKPKAAKPQWQHIDQGRSRAEANQLIKEINHSKDKLNGRWADRLGKDDDADTNGSKGRLPWLREGSDSPSGGDRTPTLQQRRTTKNTPSNPQHFGGVAGPQNSTTRTFIPYQATSGGMQPKPAKAQNQPALGGRRTRPRRMRRTFRELVMYRDTLNARILRISAPMQLLEIAEALTDSEDTRELGNRPDFTR
ncbi:MobA/MobL family protein [Sulfitobacter guttiformis]|jgi:hypothetical protein|uniref:MobA/MobL family protein n=1 Tax=Sulfitobacter guttiformis TaxID=74349 RepID=A0A420DPX1_9RHOB|nr:MobA/MobL family protein [Sulfitobacter guttiformis]KIN73562.1 putative MobA/MobL protein [Sulfitobacter guttiformis KCTC 32187]RKE96209.1 MobA/MobL family protein [Sulfitobacter guttiformis]